MFQYIQWYLSVADKGPYVGHARQVYRLVRGLPHRPGDRAHALALHHARQILSFTPVTAPGTSRSGRSPPALPHRLDRSLILADPTGRPAGR